MLFHSFILWMQIIHNISCCKGWCQTIFRMLTPGTVTEIKLKLKKLQKKWVKLETYLGLSHCRFDFAFSGAARAPITLSPKSKKLRCCVKRHQKRLLVNCRSNSPGLWLVLSSVSAQHDAIRTCNIRQNHC